MPIKYRVCKTASNKYCVRLDQSARAIKLFDDPIEAVAYGLHLAKRKRARCYLHTRSADVVWIVDYSEP